MTTRTNNQRNTANFIRSGYVDLKSMADARIRRESLNNTLTRTALVHEAAARMLQAKKPPSADKARFFAFANEVMKNCLVDRARAKRRQKRGGDRQRDQLYDVHAESDDARSALQSSLRDALQELSCMDQRKAEVVRLRFLKGLSVAETANHLGVSQPTVKRDWIVARAWLSQKLKSS